MADGRQIPLIDHIVRRVEGVERLAVLHRDRLPGGGYYLHLYQRMEQGEGEALRGLGCERPGGGAYLLILCQVVCRPLCGEGD